MNQNERLEELNKLPIARFLDAIRDAFQRHKRVVIAAPTGSGKSTVIPLLLAKEWLPAWGRTGRVVVVEPRRIAATSLAARVAELWGVRLGDQVGYVIRHDRRDSNATRLLYVTDGVIGRWLDSDPLLEGTDAVILDEFHERRTETDVALGRLLLANQKRQRMGLPPHPPGRLLGHHRGPEGVGVRPRPLLGSGRVSDPRDARRRDHPQRPVSRGGPIHRRRR